MAYLELSGDGLLPTVSSMVDVNSHINVDFLFPNGILLPFSVDYYSPLDQVKRIIWREIHNYPLSNYLRSEDSYTFVFINQMGEKEEVLDESQNIQTLQPFLALFLLVTNKSKTLDKSINKLIGSGVLKQESFNTAEIDNFKQKMCEMCKEITTLRRSQSQLEKFLWRYPLRLRSSTIIPAELKAKIINECIVIDAGFEGENMNCKLLVPYHGKPDDVIKQAIEKRSQSGTTYEPSRFILKVLGQDEYIYGNHSLIQFKYIYQCLVKKTAPQFWVVYKDKLPEAAPPVPVREPTVHHHHNHSSHHDSVRMESNVICWNIENPYQIQIKGISKVQLTDGAKVKLYVGLYHGSELLCKEQGTEDLVIHKGSSNTRTEITFDIQIANLPFVARLCFALYTLGSNNKRKNLAAWVNIPVFDFKGRLQRGSRELPMWPQDLLQHTDEHCYPLGGVSLNASSMDTTFLTMSFPDMAHVTGGGHLVYPQYDKLLECASKNMEPDGVLGSPTMKVSKIHLDQLKQALFDEQLCEQDKELIWLLRYEVCQMFPNYLAKVLKSVKWNNYVDIAKMTALLQIWPVLPVDYALEILDFEYPDFNVRQFAVKCLDSELSADELSQFMLQLVQALKFECHLYCPLAKFLLKHALKNQRLGHKFFWLLKSELYNPMVTTQYSLILESYLHHNPDHLQVLTRQHEALKKLCVLNTLVKTSKLDQPEELNLFVKKILNQESHTTSMSELYSPLSPLYKMKDLVIEKCKFMKSKKRPLWLVWNNVDELGSEIKIIYKNGDDLRQDMLTLQILQVMDDIWQAEGYDFRMNPYMCMATDLRQGMIEVVSPAETMADIQQWYKRNAFDKRALFEWLKDKHTTTESLDAAVEEFTMSCAGYCVATYVLGIGDRHNDNIMMKTSGQMFHIDFGHFLGNFKSKYYMRRERVPFVLTPHFVYVINKGGACNENFKKFKEICLKAYLILRSKFPLLMSLFMMMLSGGIPQLSNSKDASYLRETLVPHLNEEEATNHFKTKFEHALKKSWTTNLNFWFHIQNTK